MILFFIVGMTYGQGANPFDIQSDESPVVPKMEESKLEPDVQNSDNPFSIDQSVTVPVQLEPEPTSLDPTNSGTNRFSTLTMITSLLSLILIAFGISSNRLRFQKCLQSIINSNQLKGLKRSDKTYFNLQNILLYLAFALNLSLFLYMISYRFIELSFDLKWYYVLLGVVLVYGIRHVVQQLISFTFPFDSASNLHNYNGTFFIIGLTAVLLIYIIRQGKGVLFALSISGFSIIYFFIYLCAVEIAPVLILLRDIHG